MGDSIVRTMRLKVKPEGYPWLNAAAREVNVVWNYCNQTASDAWRRTDRARKWLSGYDLTYLTAGSTIYFEHIGADTIASVCTQFGDKRRGAKRSRLGWRVSGGSRRSLGWIPFRAANVRRKGLGVRFAGKTFRVFEQSSMDGLKWRDGCFAQDACGDWWLCLSVFREANLNVAPNEAVGIDLGLKTIATTSDGETLEAGRWVHSMSGKLASAQRRGHRKQAKRIQRKASRQRKDALHKFTTGIVAQYQNIVIGDVSSTQLAKTRVAKSVLDSGWGMLKAQLQYKGQQAGRSVEVVDERYTSRACSACGSLSGPRGVNGLRVREWSCECGVTHDRDINAARNILRSRYALPFAGTSDAASLLLRRAST